ncbi:DUF192 domain-containing protein [Pseudomonas sp. OIL-1]|uniref:DUF192 domain-containing protein n=1 Tax=Pseudomonas sp. OIL-1 TaxID=2706126 RepID=UPI0013A71335|nr:DUF192 domain-containing protein [Pseudomonas sp. OIL-1]QIB50480.1 DUF192 domain-containing protein [Pseudomonas sp. OIL-1]
MKNLWMWLVAALMVLSATAAAHADPLEVTLGDERFYLDVVDDPASRRQGLMGRASLAPHEGMLFDFPPDTTPAIWMRNMLISLDLLFVDDQSKLMKVFADVPPCEDTPCEIYRVERPVRFVIEVAAGTAARLELESGMFLDLGPLAEQPAPVR